MNDITKIFLSFILTLNATTQANAASGELGYAIVGCLPFALIIGGIWILAWKKAGKKGYRALKNLSEQDVHQREMERKSQEQSEKIDELSAQVKELTEQIKKQKK